VKWRDKNYIKRVWIFSEGLGEVEEQESQREGKGQDTRFLK
jgi:hypothetical protein